MLAWASFETMAAGAQPQREATACSAFNHLQSQPNQVHHAQSIILCLIVLHVKQAEFLRALHGVLQQRLPTGRRHSVGHIPYSAP